MRRTVFPRGLPIANRSGGGDGREKSLQVGYRHPWKAFSKSPKAFGIARVPTHCPTGWWPSACWPSSVWATDCRQCSQPLPGSEGWPSGRASPRTAVICCRDPWAGTKGLMVLPPSSPAPAARLWARAFIVLNLAHKR